MIHPCPGWGGPVGPRPLRADALHNRERLLPAAVQAVSRPGPEVTSGTHPYARSLHRLLDLLVGGLRSRDAG
ncbi:hypothetical protein [Micromonospora sp. DT63]|uniref:hypothetical protein n=1 Tax=Micromonospora sp. DT63 TaxID=3393441 RepID=UPI003CF01CF1